MSLVLPEGSVSREHGQFSLDNGVVQLKDLDSRAGIAVNMMFLEKGDVIQLHDRDLLTIGPWKLLIRTGDSEAEPEDPQQESSSSDDETLGAEPVMAPGRDSTSTEQPGNKPAESKPAESKPADPKPEEKKKGSTPRGDSAYTTRASIFLRLQADGSLDRELGWQEFTEKYARVIAGFARNAGLRAQDADDVLQDVLLGFFRVSDQFDYDPERGRFRGYLKRVTLNAIRARHRRKRPSTFIKDDYDPPAEICRTPTHAWDRAMDGAIAATCDDRGSRWCGGAYLEGFRTLRGPRRSSRAGGGGARDDSRCDPTRQDAISSSRFVRSLIVFVLEEG